MDKYNNLDWIENILKENSLYMNKKFGQNFLIDKNIREKIVACAPFNENSIIWEVGPGLGSLTSLLYEKAKLKVFEIDHGFCKILRSLYPNLDLVEGDALKKMKKIEEVDVLFANLPYSTGSLILAHLIENSFNIKKMVLMFQKEVVQRITSEVNSSNYGSFSILCNIDYKVKPLFEVSQDCFYPKPRVMSKVVLFEKRDKVIVDDKKTFIKLIRSSFAQRRKTLKNNLMHNTHYDKELIDEAISNLKLNPNVRAQELTLEDFNKLNNFLISALR